MPNDTFNNLNEAKKLRIFNAAVQEFSTRRFSEASINQIVKAAGIPRGSFYQYFTGKEDIFLYMFMAILEEKKKIILREGAIKPDADVFEICILTTKVTLEWSKANPNYSQISMLMEIDNSEFIVNLRADSSKGLREMIERDKERGYIKPGIDSDLIVDMISSLIMKEYYWIGLDESLFLKKINDVISIIKDGITTS